MRRHRHDQPIPDHFLFFGEADDGGLPLAGVALVDAVEIDEIDRLTRPIQVGDAVAEARPDEGQVGVGVLGLVAALLFRELLPQVELVVLVAGAFREDGLEDFDEGLDAGLPLLLETGRQPLIEVAGRRVERAIERA